MARGSFYYIDVEHPGLKKYRRVQGRDRTVVERMASLQRTKWDQEWDKLQERNRKITEVERKKSDQKMYLIEQEERAERMTQDAQSVLESTLSLLSCTLDVNDRIEWDEIKIKEDFSEEKPLKPTTAWSGKGSKDWRLPPEPSKSQFMPVFGFWDRIIPGRKARRRRESEDAFQAAREAWVRLKNEKEEHDVVMARWERSCFEWESRREHYYSNREKVNREIESLRETYASGDPVAVHDYCCLVLNRSQYPDFISKDFQLEYIADSKTVAIDYMLPTKEDIPAIESVRYVRKSDEFVEKKLTQKKIEDIYDTVLYQMALRTIHEIFEADTVGAVDAVAFNGRLKAINRATGREEEACLLTLHVGKEKFSGLNLAAIDPKECFRGLKGVSAARLSSLTPVAPIVQLNKEDERFVEAREVQVDAGVNLAAMPWEDFEHLVRQLFEQEFVASGGDVKITRASRDGGIDCVAFDPDPIRGGKIVIQAKRYTNVVGVSAVRDLYGTLINEGATKGVLVTTSRYGSDAYDFSKDKPISLIDGQHLLFLLERHGVKARINLQEAKQLLAE